jgi:hypothetical protein
MRGSQIRTKKQKTEDSCALGQKGRDNELMTGKAV